MAITPIGSCGAARLPADPGRATAAWRSQVRPAAQPRDQVTLSRESRAVSASGAARAEAPALHLSPAELRALVAPDSRNSPVRNMVDQAKAVAGAGRTEVPEGRATRRAGDYSGR
jgi:hypothetical protein